MLERLSDKIRGCYERAAEAKARADASDDPALKAEHLNAEGRWLTLARSYGFSESLEDFTAANEGWRRQFEERLREWSARPFDVGKNLDEAGGILQLHEISTLLIQEGNLESLYGRIVDVAMALMPSDMASMQSIDPESGQLRLLASKGFHPQSAAFWESVNPDSASASGWAMATGSRVIVPDVETCVRMAGTADLDEYRRSDVRAVQSTPLVSRSGQLLGMLSTHWRNPHQPAELSLRRLDLLGRQAADLIERSRAETLLRERNEQLLQLASVVESSVDSIITQNLAGLVTSWNRSAELLFGYSAEEVIGKPITIFIPTERHHEERAILERIKRGQRTEQYETVRRRKDGQSIDVSLTVSPVKNTRGEVVGASKIARDITERRRSEQRLAMLAEEAEHRTRNILAVVQSIVDLSHSDTPDGLKQAIGERVTALAKVQDLFVKSRWTGAELSSIAAQELAPYRGEDGARVRIEGPHVLLSSNAAQAIAVILHELATNAAKYGSLSGSQGKVELIWSKAADERLVMNWTEGGGPPVNKPTRQGFGAIVTERMVRGLFNGKMRLDWRTEGLACEMVLQM
jgi:PAS domain S-box-containing protein